MGTDQSSFAWLWLLDSNMNEERKEGSPVIEKYGFDDDLSFLKYNPNSDSLELSVSDGDSQNGDGAQSTSKSIISDASSWTPSLSLPESFLGSDDDLLADIPLHSLGDAATARKLISRVLTGGDLDHDRQVLNRLSNAENVASHQGHYALRALGAELRAAKEEGKDLRDEVTRLRKLLTASKEDLSDLVRAPLRVIGIYMYAIIYISCVK